MDLAQFIKRFKYIISFLIANTVPHYLHDKVGANRYIEPNNESNNYKHLDINLLP